MISTGSMRTSGKSDYLFVIIQFILFAIYLLMPKTGNSDLLIYAYIGTTILFLGIFLILAAVIQLNKNISALPTPVKNAQLITSGVFKFIRHPIYAGFVLSAFGYGLFLEDTGKILLSLILLLFFDMKSNYEEERLKEKFPEYIRYQQRTGKFTPPFFKSKN